MADSTSLPSLQVLKKDFFSKLADVLGWRIASIQELHIITVQNAIMQQPR